MNDGGSGVRLNTCFLDGSSHSPGVEPGTDGASLVEPRGSSCRPRGVQALLHILGPEGDHPRAKGLGVEREADGTRTAHFRLRTSINTLDVGACRMRQASSSTRLSEVLSECHLTLYRTPPLVMNTSWTSPDHQWSLACPFRGRADAMIDPREGLGAFASITQFHPLRGFASFQE
jgi:hypothetical protein